MNADRVLCGRYEVGEVVGRGGMAEVRVGRDRRSGRWVAIKTPRRSLARDPRFEARFHREAQLMAGLRHPAIVSVYDTGYEEVDEGSAEGSRIPFIVMEYVAGWSLRNLLDMGGLTAGKAVQYELGVLSALEFSHRAGVVHRDIKPANVMVTSEGAVKLVDFGIARASGDPAATGTHVPLYFGTPVYCSPEQARGEVVDARSDLYSAGCLLFELLTGRPPFIGDDPVSVAYQHVHEEPPRVSAYRPDDTPTFDSVLVKALAKGREDRFQDAREFGEALQAAARCVTHHDPGARVGAVEAEAPRARATGCYAGPAAPAPLAGTAHRRSTEASVGRRLAPTCPVQGRRQNGMRSMTIDVLVTRDAGRQRATTQPPARRRSPGSSTT